LKQITEVSPSPSSNFSVCPILCPLSRSMASSTRNFLAKHCEGNGYTTELFSRVGRGLYKLKK
jgi:hypothetical protein